MALRKGKSSPETCLAKPRYHEALMLRQKGMSYREIGEALGCSAPRAFKIVRKCMDEFDGQLTQDVAALRLLEAERLDRLQVAVWEKAMKGDLAAIETVLRIMKQRVRLFGLEPKNSKTDSVDAGVVFNFNFGTQSTPV